jgi:type II secretory pathway pseudopilin PulG
MFRIHRNNQFGFTLVETLVASVIGLIVLGVVFSLASNYLKWSREQSAQNNLVEQTNGLSGMLTEDIQTAGVGSGLSSGGAGIIGKSGGTPRCATYVTQDGKGLDIWQLANGGGGTISAVKTEGGITTVVLLGAQLSSLSSLTTGSACVLFPGTNSWSAAPAFLVLSEVPRAAQADDLSTPSDFASLNASLAVTLRGRLNSGTCLNLAGETATVSVGGFAAPFRRLIRYAAVSEGLKRTEYEVETGGCGMTSGNEVVIPKAILPDYKFSYYQQDGTVTNDLNAANAPSVRGIYTSLTVQDPAGTKRKTVFSPTFIQEWCQQ